MIIIILLEKFYFCVLFYISFNNIDDYPAKICESFTFGNWRDQLAHY